MLILVHLHLFDHIVSYNSDCTIYMFQVFILQLGGTKDWKLYSPVQQLARECSHDLDKDTMSTLELLMEVTMNPGDLLYFPRGTVHQAKVNKGV